MQKGTATLGQSQPKHGKTRFSIVILIAIVALIAGGTFYAGTAYQLSVDSNQLPPVNSQSSNQYLTVTTQVYSNLLNITLFLNGKAIAHAVGTLHVTLGSASAWTDARVYDIAPSQHLVFQFYPNIPVSSVDSITVQT